MKRKIILSVLLALTIVSLSLMTAASAVAQTGLVSSFSKHCQTTTTSTDFHLAIGLAAAVYVPEWEVWPGGPVVPARRDIDWQIARAPTYKIFNHETPGAFLFEDIQFGSFSEGQTYTISSVEDDPDFDDFAAFLTNGTDDNIWDAWIWPMHPTNNAGGVRCAGGPRGFHFESDVFPGIDVGSDHPEWVIRSVSLTFDSISTSRLTIDYTVDIAYGPAGSGYSSNGGSGNPSVLAHIIPTIFIITGIAIAFTLRANAIAAIVTLIITALGAVVIYQVL